MGAIVGVVFLLVAVLLVVSLFVCLTIRKKGGERVTAVTAM